jgi:hypothetical protein
MTGRRAERAQATVELAVLLPFLVLAALLVVQVALVGRDRLLVVHAARAAGRAVVVEPSVDAARLAVEPILGADRRPSVTVHGDLRPGGLAEVRVSAAAQLLPVFSRLGPVRVGERLTVRVEGG